MSISTGADNTTADFGYYVQPAGLGNWVWHDANKDGHPGCGRAGHRGGRGHADDHLAQQRDPTVVKTATDANGYYSFGNLLLDEDFDGAGTGEPTSAISVATRPLGYP